MIKNHGMFVAIKHIKTPIPGSSKCKITEVVEFIDRVRNKHTTESTAIVDYLHKKLVKSRDGSTAEEIILYLEEKYPDKMQELSQMSAMLALMNDPVSLQQYAEAFANSEEGATMDNPLIKDANDDVATS